MYRENCEQGTPHYIEIMDREKHDETEEKVKLQR